MEHSEIMEEPQLYSLSEEQIQIIAERAAKKALASVGLCDAEAGGDIRDLRTLIKAWRDLKKDAIKTIWKNMINLAFAIFIIGLSIKLGLWKG